MFATWNNASCRRPSPRGCCGKQKRLGFADSQIGNLADVLHTRVREMRKQWGIVPVYKMVDTCAAEFEAQTPYFYSTYEIENDAPSLTAKRAAVVGSGPIRIGQGIEFDLLLCARGVGAG